ncbi:23S rRNA pseudouridine(2605) synthase RluB [Motiliproteus sediminis]|uniref:23S rRNA pseudouridine(2605) synthase RluB n=1 Tax=Motiliproteus sediminis TaxID=1468178 RepID=UPI001AF00C14|nr:23S rRNA pseudouridine(2605) synthase RluB [Motiliproteus sediminis]
MSDEKLQKVLARAGLGSRREMESWIADGRAVVNGQVAKLGDRVKAGDEITVDGRPVSARATTPGCRVIVYNKPLGEVCTRKDPEGRPTVFDKLPKLAGERWISIGRLDINTSGLLLFTTDGELANKLMHPSSEVDREYAVRIHGTVNDEMLARLKEGVLLEDGMARFTDVQHFDGSGLNQWFHVVVMEGRNREVRRLWESQGVEVSRLKRVRYGCIFLSKRVAAGRWEELGQKELNDLCDMVDLPRRKRAKQTKEELQADRRVQRRARPVRDVGRRKSAKGGH